MGSVVTAAVASISGNNADPFGIDLADLSKNGPTQEYRIWSRARMKFGVRLDFPGIVVFSGFDRLNDALKPGIGGFW